MNTISTDALLSEARKYIIAAQEAADRYDMNEQHRLIDEAGRYQAAIRDRPDGWKAFLPLLRDEKQEVRLMAAGMIHKHDREREIGVFEDL